MAILKTYTKTAVNLGKLQAEIKAGNCVTNFECLAFSETKLDIFGDAILVLATLDLLVANHVVSDPIGDENAKFVQRRLDGISEVTNLMSELFLNSKANNHPRIVNKSIEDAFNDTIAAVSRGWWVVAKEKAELVVVTVYVTQAFKDRVLLKINSYIAQSYV